MDINHHIATRRLPGRLAAGVIALVTVLAGAVVAEPATASASAPGVTTVDAVVGGADSTYPVPGRAAIAGTVLGVDEDPAPAWRGPLVGASVAVFDATTGRLLRTATTDSSGHFRVSGLRDGAVKVRAAKPGWLTVYANGSSTLAGATAFRVRAGRTTLVPAPLVMSAEAVIQGQALGWMDPLGGVTVSLLRADTGAVVRSVTTGSSGDYRFGGLAAGSYKVRGSHPGWLTAYADGKSLATAGVYTLVAGQTLSQSWDPQVLYLDLTPEAVVHGTVTGEGAPLGGATVAVLDATSGAVLKAVRTDAAGAYRIGMLAQGQVKIRATKAGWLPAYANGRASLAAADTLSLMAGQTLQDPLLDLTTGGVLTGELMGFSYSPSDPWDDPLGGATVTVLDADTGKALRSVTSGTSASECWGCFRFDGLPAGRYVLRTTAPGWATSYAYDKNTFASADVYTVVAGQTTEMPWPWHIYAEVIIEGQVLGEMEPLGGAVVTVFDADTDRVLKKVTADDSGHYRVTGLPSGERDGRYKVRATAPGWVASYANGKHSLAYADVFTVAAGRTLTQSWDPLVLYLDLERRP